jgi:hypothetical protein
VGPTGDFNETSPDVLLLLLMLSSSVQYNVRFANASIDDTHYAVTGHALDRIQSSYNNQQPQELVTEMSRSGSIFGDTSARLMTPMSAMLRIARVLVLIWGRRKVLRARCCHVDSPLFTRLTRRKETEEITGLD